MPGPLPSARCRRVGRARRALLGGLSAFLALNLALAVALHAGGPWLRDPGYAHRLAQLQQRMAAPGQPRTVVMLGSSRTEFGLRAGDLDALLSEAVGQPVVAFNFGKSGAGPLLALFNWYRLQRAGVRPDLLLVEVLPGLLGDTPNWHELDERYLPTEMLSWQDLPFVERYAGGLRPHLRRDWLWGAAVPCYSHRLVLLSNFAPDLLPRQRRAPFFAPSTPSGDLHERDYSLFVGNRAAALAAARGEHSSRLADFRFGARPCAALAELLQSCRAAEVPVALVVMPEGPTFRTWYPPGTWEKIEAHLRALSQEHGAALVNARAWMAEEDFGDSHHLLLPGARKFTARLGQEALVPLLRGESSPRQRAAIGRR